MVRGALAGVAAAAAWAAAAPVAARLCRPPPGFSDVRVLGAILTRDGPRWRRVGLAVHLVDGAVFGAAFAALGGRGWRHGLVAAQAENVVLWPGMAMVDRLHPDRRAGRWPPLHRSRQVFAYEVTVHALFGVVLGLLAGPTQSPASSSSFSSSSPS